MLIRFQSYIKLFLSGFFLFSLIGLSGQVNNAIFYGSIEDGYDSECYEQTSSNPIFTGSIGDGYGTLCMEQITSNPIFTGSVGDGYSSICLEQSTSNSIFAGSAGDGYNAFCFEQSTSNSIFAGSDGDGYNALCFEQSTSNSIFAGSNGDGFSRGCGYFIDDCLVFSTAPVDLSKSFDPVNGVKDRVQLKWYKDTPEIRYADEDAAMCDIKFWKKRFLDPPTGDPIGPVIQNPDTILLNNVKKTYPDNSPREIFKWPVKYRADGVNNSNRAEPNFRYEWKVRCECGHDGNGPESPWSVIRIFNTPDFDPVTGIFTPPRGQEDLSLTKSLTDEGMQIQLYPNPNDGTFRIRFEIEEKSTDIQLTLRDIQGKLIQQEIRSMENGGREILWKSKVNLEMGIYLMEIITDQNRYTKSVIIDR